MDRLLVSGGSFRDAGALAETSPAAAHRHSKHIRRALAAVAEEDPAAYGRAILRQVRHLTDRSVRLLDTAEAQGDLRAAVAAIREARGCLELVARLEGQIVDRHAHLHAHVIDESARTQIKRTFDLPPRLSAAISEAAQLAIVGDGTGAQPSLGTDSGIVPIASDLAAADRELRGSVS